MGHRMTRIKTPYSILRIWAGLTLALLATQPAAAGETRTIVSTGDASSECIGDPRTPLCALDTWEACFEWRERSLCELVGLEEIAFSASDGEKPRRVYLYQPYDVLEIEARHLADIENRLVRLSPDKTWFRPGYIDIRYRFCDYEDRDRCEVLGEGVAIILKPVGEAWHVSGWHHDVYDCEYYDLPDGYSARFGHCNLMIPPQDFTDYDISRRSAERRQRDQGD